MPNLYCLDRSLKKVNYRWLDGKLRLWTVIANGSRFYISGYKNKTRQDEARKISEIILSERVMKCTFEYILCNSAYFSSDNFFFNSLIKSGLKSFQFSIPRDLGGKTTGIAIFSELPFK